LALLGVYAPYARRTARTRILDLKLFREFRPFFASISAALSCAWGVGATPFLLALAAAGGVRAPRRFRPGPDDPSAKRRRPPLVMKNHRARRNPSPAVWLSATPLTVNAAVIVRLHFHGPNAVADRLDAGHWLIYFHPGSTGGFFRSLQFTAPLNGAGLRRHRAAADEPAPRPMSAMGQRLAQSVGHRPDGDAAATCSRGQGQKMSGRDHCADFS